MHLISLLALVVAVASAIVACRRRWVRVLGRRGNALAPGFLLIAWFVGLGLGQKTGSLAGMAWIAALPVTAIAAWAVATSRPLRRMPSGWTWWDRGAFALIAAFLLAYCGNDSFGHDSMVGAYLRGNIPPTAQDDPTRPLLYHLLFDAAAAVVVEALGVSPETALDLVGIVCVYATLASLQTLTRALFAGAWSRQCARLFFLLGFGPIYLNDIRGLVAKLSGGRTGPLGSFLFHGHTTQSFVEALPRRPMGLNFALLAFVLSACLPRLRSATQVPGKLCPPPMLLPCAFLLPQATEELAGLAGLLAVGLWLAGALPFRWMLAWGAAVLVAVPLSGTLPALLARPMPGRPPAPRIALAWPPTFPLWADPADPASGSREAAWAVIREGVPLASKAAAWAVFSEWGPWFLGGLVLALRDPRRRALVALVGVGIVLACGLRLDHWIKADLDRFLFPGTCAGFLLVAGWIELLERARDRGRLRRGGFVVLALLVIVPTMLGPVGFAVRYIVPYATGANARLPIRFSEAELVALRADLAAVGPRDLVETDARKAQDLVLAGFVVKAPLAPGFSIGIVQPERMDAYLAEHPTPVAAWLFLPETDRRVSGQVPRGRHGEYVLVANREPPGN